MESLPGGRAFDGSSPDAPGAGNPLAATGPVNPIPDNRVADVCHVHPDLMGATGLQLDP